MWIERSNKKSEFIQSVKSLKRQVLVLRGARQVGKTSFIAGSIGKIKREVIVFLDEADKYPLSLELIQNLAGLSDKLKVIYTGSNLENILLKNAATGRKRYFDLY